MEKYCIEMSFGCAYKILDGCFYICSFGGLCDMQRPINTQRWKEPENICYNANHESNSAGVCVVCNCKKG